MLPDMFFWLMFLGSVLSTPTDEFAEFTRTNGENADSQYQEKLLRNMVPRIFDQKQKQWNSADIGPPDLIAIDPSNKYLKNFNSYVEKGTTLKSLTFTIYDDNMRDAAIALFRVFQATEGSIFEKIKNWAKDNINREMYMYALRLESVYSGKTKQDDILPPFIWNPNYFVNAETLTKALLIIDTVRFGRIDPQYSKVDQYNYTFFTSNEFVTINSNYSGWNLPKERQDYLNYFREDVSLNSYYLGLHLLHPFWMSNEELDFNNPRHAEHYYYAHQQLMARYDLEKLHLLKTEENKSKNKMDESSHIPYLSYKNGLPFPTRPCYRRDWDDERALLKTIDIAIRECISRGLIIMQNGTTHIPMNDDSHIDTLAKLIRANLDGIKVAKIARSIFGYGGNKYPIDEYNPAPSLLHQPETSLRDPAYWYMIQHMLHYFTEYKRTMEPYDLSRYEFNEIKIINEDFTKIETCFENYRFTLNYATSFKIKDESEWPAYVTVRQRRLQHSEFALNFTVESTTSKNAIVRLYMGPLCTSSDCWDEYYRFYELDTFLYILQEGVNTIHWSANFSNRLSFDSTFDNILPRPSAKKHSIFKFPENLVIPRGLEEGLNLTLFVMITPADNDTIPNPQHFYREVSYEMDSKPLGFPFHRKAINYNPNANSYRFYNISIYHKRSTVSETGYFSPHLY